MLSIRRGKRVAAFETHKAAKLTGFGAPKPALDGFESERAVVKGAERRLNDENVGERRAA